jgi:hypothetical protein
MPENPRHARQIAEVPQIVAPAGPAGVKGWLTRGRREAEGEYARFASDVDRAREETERASRVPMTEAEHRLAVSELGRAGSVSALKLYWEILLEDCKRGGKTKPKSDSLAAVDELAARRAVKP